MNEMKSYIPIKDKYFKNCLKYKGSLVIDYDYNKIKKFLDLTEDDEDVYFKLQDSQGKIIYLSGCCYITFLKKYLNKKEYNHIYNDWIRNFFDETIYKNETEKHLEYYRIKFNEGKAIDKKIKKSIENNIIDNFKDDIKKIIKKYSNDFNKNQINKMLKELINE